MATSFLGRRTHFELRSRLLGRIHFTRFTRCPFGIGFLPASHGTLTYCNLWDLDRAGSIYPGPRKQTLPVTKQPPQSHSVSQKTSHSSYHHSLPPIMDLSPLDTFLNSFISIVRSADIDRNAVECGDKQWSYDNLDNVSTCSALDLDEK
jgi:hypothetical protein